MVSYLPEIRAGMALLLAFCAMVQDLRNFKIDRKSTRLNSSHNA